MKSNPVESKKAREQQLIDAERTVELLEAALHFMTSGSPARLIQGQLDAMRQAVACLKGPIPAVPPPPEPLGVRSFELGAAEAVGSIADAFEDLSEDASADYCRGYVAAMRRFTGIGGESKKGEPCN